MPTETPPDVRSGGEGLFKLAGVAPAIIGWTGGEQGTFVDTTTTKQHNTVRKKTYTRQKETKLVYRATIEAFCDESETLLGNLRVGAELETVVLESSETGYQVTMAKAIVKSVPVKSGNIGGVSSYTFEIDSQEDYDITFKGASIDLVAGP